MRVQAVFTATHNKKYILNPSFSGGRDQEDYSLRPAWAKSEERPPSQPIGQVTCSYNPSYTGGYR
jgi:hypothetical protein